MCGMNGISFGSWIDLYKQQTFCWGSRNFKFSGQASGFEFLHRARLRLCESKFSGLRLGSCMPDFFEAQPGWTNAQIY